MTTKTTGLLELVQSELRSRRGTWPQIATDTGIPYFTLSKIASGAISDPGIRKIEILAAYFRNNPRAA